MEDPKYKFVETQGCTAFGFSVNGMDLSDLSKESRDEIIDYLCKKMKQGVDEGSVLFSDIVKVFQEADHESDERPCEQCFDTVSRTVWEV